MRLIEMTGEPGDAFFLHPWILHTSSPNSSDLPRIMVLERIKCVSEERNESCFECKAPGCLDTLVGVFRRPSGWPLSDCL